MIAVVGGGPSGMMAALSAKKHNPGVTVTLFDRNMQLGKKMRLTGGGRCNVTANVSNQEIVDCVVKNGRFLYSSLTHFNAQDIMNFFEGEGVALKEEDHHRVFPQSNKSADIVEALENALRKEGVVLRLGVDVSKVNDDSIVVDGKTVMCDHIILATGGKTLPQTGSDGSGYGFAVSLGHTVTNLLPQEVPLVSNDVFIQEKKLQGLSFKDVTLTVKSKKKTLVTLTHDLIFTHFGLSGPAALRASFYVQKALSNDSEPVTLELNFIPGYSELPETHVNMQKRLLDFLGVKDALLYEKLTRFTMRVYATRGFPYAFVTNGGVSVKEVDPKTMRSRINPRVSFCGELLDISAYTGGYNITACLTSGYTAGKYCLD